MKEQGHNSSINKAWEKSLKFSRGPQRNRSQGENDDVGITE